ncbi:MAG: hypothetical protein Q8P59_12790 [Dehalococcoidia bacterium]|nr:hypothetical protein [Dehalococcoidia bacterium]
METRWPGAWPPTSALAGDRPQRYVLRLVLVLCLSLALVACAQPRQGDGAKSPAPSPSPGTPIALSEQGQGGLGKVAFVRGGDIFALDFASGQERKLAEGKTPRWSPDGQWVYFSKGKEGWRARPDGSGLQPIGPIALFPPKGDRLA